jgi:NAD(P)-dependent dehydrogenase (short-subunit alcohol dehydrogenase family)
MIDGRLAGKTALVTGSGQGIGEGIAKVLKLMLRACSMDGRNQNRLADTATTPCYY